MESFPGPPPPAQFLWLAMCCYVLGRLILLVAISEIECVRGEPMAHQGEGVPIQGYLLLMGEQLESIEKMVIGIIDGY